MNSNKKNKTSLNILILVIIVDFVLMLVILGAVAYSAGVFDEFKGFDPIAQSALSDSTDPEELDGAEPNSTPEPTPEVTPEPTPLPLEALGATLSQEQKDLLILVNKAHPIADDYNPTLVDLPRLSDFSENGSVPGTEVYIDARCVDDLYRMLDDCIAAGFNPYICSPYRDLETQAKLFDEKVQRVIQETGYEYEEAKIEAARSVATPGTSEHHLGLAVDLIDYEYSFLTEDQEKTGTQQWLMQNSWKYGFILRYPSEKSDITYIKYEPWHYRYVGIENAASIHDSGLCLEEYLEKIGL